jgi:hypothetical protein
MNGSVSRRSLVAAAPLALAACGRAEETYSGERTRPTQDVSSICTKLNQAASILTRGGKEKSGGLWPETSWRLE